MGVGLVRLLSLWTFSLWVHDLPQLTEYQHVFTVSVCVCVLLNRDLCIPMWLLTEIRVKLWSLFTFCWRCKQTLLRGFVVILRQVNISSIQYLVDLNRRSPHTLPAP